MHGQRRHLDATARCSRACVCACTSYLRRAPEPCTARPEGAGETACARNKSDMEKRLGVAREAAPACGARMRTARTHVVLLARDLCRIVAPESGKRVEGAAHGQSEERSRAPDAVDRASPRRARQPARTIFFHSSPRSAILQALCIRGGARVDLACLSVFSTALAGHRGTRLSPRLWAVI